MSRASYIPQAKPLDLVQKNDLSRRLESLLSGFRPWPHTYTNLNERFPRSVEGSLEGKEKALSLSQPWWNQMCDGFYGGRAGEGDLGLSSFSAPGLLWRCKRALSSLLALHVDPSLPRWHLLLGPLGDIGYFGQLWHLCIVPRGSNPEWVFFSNLPGQKGAAFGDAFPALHRGQSKV